MCHQLLQIAHERSNGGRRSTAAEIQSVAYWPTWSSDLVTFLKQCRSGDQNNEGDVNELSLRREDIPLHSENQIM
jgi:hypothetical protein